MTIDAHDDKGFSEEKCLRCGWTMGHAPLNCNNDDTPHVFPSQLRPREQWPELPPKPRPLTLREKLAEVFCVTLGHEHEGRPECRGTELADHVIGIVRSDDEHRVWAGEWLRDMPLPANGPKESDARMMRGLDVYYLLEGAPHVRR